MIGILSYIFLISLILIALFFLLRSIVVVSTMLSDVPFIPSNRTFRKALKYLEIKDGSRVLDIGSGDGRVLFYASKRYPNSEFVGIEKNLFLVIYSNIKRAILFRKNLKFKYVDIFNFNISKFDRIYMFLETSFIERLMIKKRDEIGEGCILISFHFPIINKFDYINKIEKYTVKYKGRKENIFKYIKK